MSEINDLENKVIDLSLRLKRKNIELNSVKNTNSKVIGKLIHNLKNPVGVIMSFSEMMLDDGYDISKVKTHLDIIHKSSKFSVNFLNAIAKYLEIHSVDFELELKQLDITELLDAVLVDFNKDLENHPRILEQKKLPSPILINGDASYLTYAFQNLLNNAIRFSNDHSTISVSLIENTTAVSIEILDEGMGISKDHLSQLFDEFFVVNTYSKDKVKCIGLGLTNTKLIIEKHFGSISVESQLEKGTKFTISIPKIKN